MNNNILWACLGAVSPGDALPEWDDGGTNSGHVQRSSHGALPQPALLTSRHHYQRHGNWPTLHKLILSLASLCAEIIFLGLFFVVCIPQVVPNYSSRSDYERMFALGVSMWVLVSPFCIYFYQEEKSCGHKPTMWVQVASCNPCSVNLSVPRYGQMTAGSYCYIGPQGIVHGTMVGGNLSIQKYYVLISSSQS